VKVQPEAEVNMVKDRVTVQEAARRLGVKDDAIRKRIQRGTIEHDKDPDGRVFVYLDATQDAAKDSWTEKTSYASTHDATEDTSYVEIVDVLRDQVEYLRGVIEARDRELEARAEELRRKDTIIMSLTQRIPELSQISSQEPRNGSESAAGVDPRGESSQQPTKTPHTDEQQSWWRRFFGF
jgi:excisionase family DNA binding protein